MNTVIREGYVRKGKVLGKSMKKKYLLLRCASEKSMNAQLEMYDDQKQVRKKASPNSVISMKSVAGVKRIEAPMASGATLKDGGYFIRLDVNSDRGGVEEVYMSLDNRDLFEEWLTDLEFLVRLPDLIIPLSHVPKRDLPLLTQTSIDKRIFGEIDFEDACPVETIQTELGLKWQVNNRIFILVLTRTTLTFLDPHAGIQALTYNIQNLRRCGHWQKLVFIEAGRRTDTGPGYLWLYIHSKILAKNFYTTLSNVMGSTQQMMIIQKHLCWDKFREELPPGSVRTLSDSSGAIQGPVSDNDTYGIESFEYIHALADTNAACPPLPPNHPNAMVLPPPLGHQSTHQLLRTSDSEQHRSPQTPRQEDNILPPTPLESMKKRASLPGREQCFTDNKEASFSNRADTFSGVHIKTRYDMLVPGDTHDLHVGTNGHVETKYNFANTDGKGNIVKEGSKRAEHSYYDVNDIITELSGKARSPTPKKKRSIIKNDSSKFNTISVVKLSSTASKEKIGKSTFYKTSMPITEPSSISPYAKFSDLDTQVPPEVRKERIRQLSLKHNASMEQPSGVGSPLFPGHASVPNTPLVLYATPQNIPVEAHYKLVDPKPRPVLCSSSSLPEVLPVGDMSIYNSPNNFPVSQDYQHPFNNAEVVLPPSEISVGPGERKSALNMTGGYDHLAANEDDEIIFIEDSKTINNTDAYRVHSPLYEKMEVRIVTPERNAVSLSDDITFAFAIPDSSVDKHSLDTLVESPVGICFCDGEISDANEVSGPCTAGTDTNRNAEISEDNVPISQPGDEISDGNSPETLDRIQKMSSQTNVEDVIELDSQLYETMTGLSIKKTRKSASDSLVNNRYQNIYPFNKPSPLTTKPTNIARRESSPMVTQKKKPVLEHAAKSCTFSRTSSSDGHNIYYAELDLYKDDKSTVIVNTIHTSGPATHYDKIDHKLSNILKDTIQHHRETKNN